jgi:hypothetical protein
MSYKPQDEDGISFTSFGAGSQLNFSVTPGGSSGVLRSVSVTNSEDYPLLAEVSFVCRLRTELVNGGRRTDFEGNFYAESTTGATIYGVDRHYAEVHMPGTNGVTSSLWGHPAGEGLQVTGNIIPMIEIAPGQTEDVRARFLTSAAPENVRNTVAANGYVQCLGGLVKLFQKRGPTLDGSVTVT